MLFLKCPGRKTRGGVSGLKRFDKVRFMRAAEFTHSASTHSDRFRDQRSEIRPKIKYKTDSEGVTAYKKNALGQSRFLHRPPVHRKWENPNFRPPSWHSWSTFISEFFTFTVRFGTKGQFPFFSCDFISLLRRKGDLKVADFPMNRFMSEYQTFPFFRRVLRLTDHKMVNFS